MVATSPTAGQAIGIAKRYQSSLGKVNIVASDDCTNLKPGLFLSVAGIWNKREDAQHKVSANRKTVRDSYARACQMRPGSRMQFGIDAVEPSIFEVPSDAVNWDDRDRVSEVLGAGPIYVWIRRQYQKDKEDPREGRRTSLWVFRTDPSSAQVLVPDCFDAQVVVSDRLVATACAIENAADHLLHQVQVIDTNFGRPIRTVDRCRNPAFVRGTELGCEAETVGPDGALKLTPVRFPLKIEVRPGTRGRRP